MNPIAGTFVVFAYVMAVVFGLPLAAVFVLNLAFGTPNLRKVGENPVIMERQTPLLVDTPLPVAINKTSGSAMNVYDAIPEDS